MKEKNPPFYVLEAGSIAATIAGKANQDHVQDVPVKQVSVPLRYDQLAAVECFASRAGQSRGAMVATLVRLGLELVTSQLDAESAEEVQSEITQRFGHLMDEYNPTEE